jgi:hypothetical protein
MKKGVKRWLGHPQDAVPFGSPFCKRWLGLRQEPAIMKEAGNKLIRFNPNACGFDLSDVLREINAVLFALPYQMKNEKQDLCD